MQPRPAAIAVDVLFVADRGELAPLFSRIADALSLTYAIAAGGALTLDGTRVAAFPSPVLRLCPRVLVGPGG